MLRMASMFPVLLFVPITVGAITIPGTSNIWLAGMPPGTVAGGADKAPDHSPVQYPGAVAGFPFWFEFYATGAVSNGGCCPLVGPDGDASFTVPAFAPENGISSINAPVNALVGVFLDDSDPSLTPPPGGLDFFGPGALDFIDFYPLLKQVFFIGDGMTAAAVPQVFWAPSGATRLFFGTIDGYEWNNNLGSFEVEVRIGVIDVFVPEPSTWLFVAGGLALAGALRPFSKA